MIFDLLFLTAIATMTSAVLTSVEIPILKHRQFQQFIREEGPQSHLSKAGTPTMGGIAICATLVFITLATSEVTMDTVVMLDVTLLFAGIGFFDDYMKVAKKHKASCDIYLCLEDNNYYIPLNNCLALVDEYVFKTKHFKSINDYEKWYK